MRHLIWGVLVGLLFAGSWVEAQSALDSELAELLNLEPTGHDSDYSLGLEQWDTPYGPASGHGGSVLGFYSIGVYLAR